MSDTRAVLPSAEENRLLDRIEAYTAQGLPRGKVLALLLSEGFDLATLKTRFPSPVEEGTATARAARPTLPPAPIRAAAAPPPAPPLDPARVLADLNARRKPAATIAEPTTPNLAGRPASAPALTSAEEGALSFHYVPLIQCSFPHTDPGEVTSFTRRNGWLELTLGTTRPDTGLPYGVPARLLTIYLTSEAVRSRSPEIFLGHSVHDFLRRLDVPITRGPRGSLTVYANQLLRLIHSTLTIDENIRDASGRAGLHIRQAVFADEARLWWDTDGVGQGSSLALSPALFESILERSAPLSTLAIRQLRKSPMDLDVYAWLAHRLFHLGKPSRVTWPQLSAQFGHGYAELRKFRRYFLDALKRVQAVYPAAKVTVGEGGVWLLPSRPHVARIAR
jgi:hypothetical protein